MWIDMAMRDSVWQYVWQYCDMCDMSYSVSDASMKARGFSRDSTGLVLMQSAELIWLGFSVVFLKLKLTKEWESFFFFFG